MKCDQLTTMWGGIKCNKPASRAIVVWEAGRMETGEAVGYIALFRCPDCYRPFHDSVLDVEL